MTTDDTRRWEAGVHVPDPDEDALFPLGGGEPAKGYAHGKRCGKIAARHAALVKAAREVVDWCEHPDRAYTPHEIAMRVATALREALDREEQG
jgi:hypothetical protein